MITKSMLCLFVGLVFVAPVFAQSGENADWQAIDDQRDLRRKAELLDAFIKKYAQSGHRPDADFQLIDFYTQNKDYQKIMQLAADYQQRPPSGDATAKVRIFTQAMVAAASLNNIPKTVEFSGYALQADPNNLTVLSFLAGSNLPDSKKAMEYAQKAITLPRPATMKEDQYNLTMGRLHSMVALPLFADQKFGEAKEHLQIALKANPKDQASQYRMGFAEMNLMAGAVKAAQDAQEAATKALLAQPPDKAAADSAKEKLEASSKEALELRDSALDSLAKALAIGGPATAQVTPIFENLYKSKNQSLDGKDDFIAKKKVELGL
jgi:hypothetical protein